MKLKDDELKIFYGGGLDEDLDTYLENALSQLGYSRWASGYEIESGVRDLAFDKKDRTYREES